MRVADLNGHSLSKLDERFAFTTGRLVKWLTTRHDELSVIYYLREGHIEAVIILCGIRMAL